MAHVICAMVVQGSLDAFTGALTALEVDFDRGDSVGALNELMVETSAYAMSPDELLGATASGGALVLTGDMPFALLSADVAVRLSGAMETTVLSVTAHPDSDLWFFCQAERGAMRRLFFTEDGDPPLDHGEPLPWESETEIDEDVQGALAAARALGVDLLAALGAGPFDLIALDPASLPAGGEWDRRLRESPTPKDEE